MWGPFVALFWAVFFAFILLSSGAGETASVLRWCSARAQQLAALCVLLSPKSYRMLAFSEWPCPSFPPQLPTPYLLGLTGKFVNSAFPLILNMLYMKGCDVQGTTQSSQLENCELWEWVVCDQTSPRPETLVFHFPPVHGRAWLREKWVLLCSGENWVSGGGAEGSFWNPQK